MIIRLSKTTFKIKNKMESKVSFSDKSKKVGHFENWSWSRKYIFGHVAVRERHADRHRLLV